MTENIFNSTDYLTISEALFELHKRSLKNPGIDEIKTCAKHLGLWHQKALSFRNDTEVGLFGH